VSVVVPAFNEVEHLAATVESLAAQLERNWPDAHEIVIVDDGSSDGTLATALAVSERVGGCTVVSYPRNRGKGYALRRGFAASSGDLVAFIDADGEIAAADVVPLLRAAERGVSIVVGRRRWRRGRPAIRRLGSRVVAALTKLAFRLPVAESQAGAKAFVRADVAAELRACRESGYLFDLELLVRAHRRGVGMTSIDVATSVVRPCRIGVAVSAREAITLARLWWTLGLRPAEAPVWTTPRRATVPPPSI
jgi:glycosyltransferase involved in cell wall biosynthesis